MKVWTDVKINLGLSVLRKRPDGFHDLETLFVPFRGFGDSLEITCDVRQGGHPGVPPGHLGKCRGTGMSSLPAPAQETDSRDCTPRPTFAQESGCGVYPVQEFDSRECIPRPTFAQEAGCGVYPVQETDSRECTPRPTFAQMTRREGGTLPAADVDIEITNCDWDPMKDLTVQAYRMLKADFPELPPVSIRLEKHAPVGAGLGGGSADAAYALRMMNGMFGLNLGTERLAAYAARLGSDCAFFIYDRPMFGTGRGELLEPYDIDLSAWDIRVEIPEGPGVSTREAYSGIVPRERRSETLMPLREALSRPVSEWRDVLVNDFERTVFPLHPEIAALKERMYADGAVYAAMSGSGSSVFGLFKKR